MPAAILALPPSEIAPVPLQVCVTPNSTSASDDKACYALCSLSSLPVDQIVVICVICSSYGTKVPPKLLLNTSTHLSGQNYYLGFGAPWFDPGAGSNSMLFSRRGNWEGQVEPAPNDDRRHGSIGRLLRVRLCINQLGEATPIPILVFTRACYRPPNWLQRLTRSPPSFLFGCCQHHEVKLFLCYVLSCSPVLVPCVPCQCGMRH